MLGIIHHHVDTFYVGRQGIFDSIVRCVLKEPAQIYPHIKFFVVLERVPERKNEFIIDDYSETILPEGIENISPRYAISWRNRWMLRQAEYVVTYIPHSWGEAVKFALMAVKAKKKVHNLTKNRAFFHLVNG